MQIINLNIQKIGHDTFKIKSKDLVIYTDPFKLENKTDLEKADLILISHEHKDHCDPASVEAISKEDTKIIASGLAVEKLGKGKVLEPEQEIEIKGVKIKGVPAYNTKRFRSPGIPFHPKEAKMLGFVFAVDGTKIYFAGDTDLIPEMEKLSDEKIDIAMLPISDVYVMNEEEAAKAIEAIKPKIVIPMHYGTLEQVSGDPERFKRMIGDLAEVKIL